MESGVLAAAWFWTRALRGVEAFAGEDGLLGVRVFSDDPLEIRLMSTMVVSEARVSGVLHELGRSRIDSAPSVRIAGS